MPRKVKELVAELLHAGFQDRGGKGSHRNFLHPAGLRITWSPEDRCFVGSAPPLIGRCCHGPTEAGVLRQLRKIVDDWIRLQDMEGVTLPTPEKMGKYSGRFVLRVPAPVHQALALKARAAGKSLNSYCAEKLGVL